jgi:hypothetical protein
VEKLNKIIKSAAVNQKRKQALAGAQLASNMIYRAKTGAGSLISGFFIYLVVLLNG